MTTFIRTNGVKSLFAALSLSAAMTAPLAAQAQDITLRANDGSLVEVAGTLLNFDGAIYTIDSNLGAINLRAELFDCVAGSCPSIELVSANQSVDGSIVWDVSLWGSRRAFTEHVEKLAELVDEKTDGALKLNLSYGGLAPSRENLDGIAAGDFEMAQFCAGYHPEKNPSITVLELPFLGVGSMEQERAVSQTLYEHPAVVADLARWNATILMPTPQPQYNIAGVGSPPTSIAAFSNLTVRATGGTGQAIKALGASSITLPAPEVNAALSRGEINAVAFAPHAHMAFNTVDSALWWTTNLNPGTANCPIVVNSEALNDLPAASRIALLSSVDEALDHFIDNYKTTTMAAWDTALVENGIIELTINDEILNAINAEVAGPSAISWIANNDALGLPAQELFRLVATTVRQTQ